MLALVSAFSIVATGCDDDPEINERPNAVSRPEVLLVVQNADSPLDLLQSTEANSVSFGSDSGDLILEATEVSTRRTRNITASNDGNDLLISAEEVRVRFTDDDGDGTGTLMLLDGDEVEIAREDDVLLSGTEAQMPGVDSTLDDKLLLTATELDSGRWDSLAAAAIDLAERETISGVETGIALNQLLGDLRAEVGSLQDLLLQAETDNPLPAGVTARPTLYRTLESDEAFATNFSFESLAGTEARAEISQFFVGSGQELIDVASGSEVQRTFLPQFLEDVDGYVFNLDADGDLVRFRLNWSTIGDLDLHVITPSGAEIFHDNETADGGLIDLDNTAGGPGSIENVVFGSGRPGEYTAFAEYREGAEPAEFELTAYIDGRIVERLRGTLQPPVADGSNAEPSRSELITIRVE